MPQILSLLESNNPALAGSRARQASAAAGLVTARAYPNPEVEVGGGSSTGIGAGALNGPNQQLYVDQLLDLPFVREARRQVAEAGITAADEGQRFVLLAVRAQARLAYYDILRRQAELVIAEDNEKLLMAIRDKVRLKVEVGEAPRYEAVKAEAELLGALKLRQSAQIRVDDAKSALRALFGQVVPQDFEAVGELPPPYAALPGLAALREEVLHQHPALHQARAEVQRSEAKLDLEQKLRYPQPSIRAGFERDPGLESWRVGISVPLPLWNQRQGPIAEAAADLSQTEAQFRYQELTILRELESTYNRYLIAHRQVETFEAGLLQEAQKALKVAESAYRLGERGILDYLDAQRTFRSVRNDYLNAQFDRQAAMIELDRLRAVDSLDTKP